MSILVSIQLNSNRPDKLAIFFDSLVKTTTHPEQIEVLVNIDTGDNTMRDLLEVEKKHRSFKIRYIETPRGTFFDLWKPLNILLKETHPDAYFIINVSDEFLFITQGWDVIIAKYKGYFPDDVFRLRCSQLKYHNYTDVWECGFAPDSLAFYTKKWLDICEGWNPCFGPDSFQQMVAFFLFTSDPFAKHQTYRDIPLNDVRFEGEGANIGLTGDAYFERARGHIRAWFTLMSHKMQQEAKRRAIRLKCHILAYEKNVKDFHIEEDRRHRNLNIMSGGNCIATLPYGLSWLRVTLTNQWRKPKYCYYGGGGNAANYLTDAYLWGHYEWYWKLRVLVLATPSIVKKRIRMILNLLK